MKTIIIGILLLTGTSVSFAQTCGNCKITPSIALYDLDVQVPQPELKGEKTEGWLEWQQLFWLAKHFNSIVYQNNKNCIRFTQPASDDNDQLHVGATHTNLPSSNKNVSQYGNYFITGTVKKSGNSYVMHVELLSSCSRKTVVSADIPFQMSVESSNTIATATQAATRFNPLIEKIKTFETEERSRNQKFALGGDWDRIKIIPAKTKLTAGQQTEFTLELKDCDDKPLAGREIVFTESNIGGGIMPGTIGGTVTPAKVVTDVNGKAKANFKMTASSGKPAIINAHTVTQTPQNCQGVLFGDAQIDAMAAYKIVLTYNRTATFDLEMESNEDRVVMAGSDHKRDEVSYTFSLLHYISSSPKDGEQVMIMPQFENEPEYQNSKGGKTIVLNLDGYSESKMVGKPLELVQSPFGPSQVSSKTETQRYFSIAPLLPSLSLMFKNNELVFFSASVEFPEPAEGLSPVNSSFSMNHEDPSFPIKPKKVTDPNSVYKWVYEFTYQQGDRILNQGKVFNYEKKEGEGATIQIWKSF